MVLKEDADLRKDIKVRGLTGLQSSLVGKDKNFKFVNT